VDNQKIVVRFPQGREVFPPNRRDQSWGPPGHLSNGYCILFPWGYSGWGVKLTTHH